jgi:hypothetical protein
MSDAFSSLLAPLSVALVGASDDPTRIGGRPLALSQGVRFQGRRVAGQSEARNGAGSAGLCKHRAHFPRFPTPPSSQCRRI